MTCPANRAIRDIHRKYTHLNINPLRQAVDSL